MLASVLSVEGVLVAEDDEPSDDPLKKVNPVSLQSYANLDDQKYLWTLD